MVSSLENQLDDAVDILARMYADAHWDVFASRVPGWDRPPALPVGLRPDLWLEGGTARRIVLIQAGGDDTGFAGRVVRAVMFARERSCVRISCFRIDERGNAVFVAST